MPLFVLYRNHRDETAWRQVLTMSQPFMALYPPTEALLKASPGPIDTTAEMGRPLIEARLAYCVKCMLADRDAPRNLKMSSILGFHEGPIPPEPNPAPNPDKPNPPIAKTAIAKAVEPRPRDGDGAILARLGDIVRICRREGHTSVTAGIDDIARLLAIVAERQARSRPVTERTMRGAVMPTAHIEGLARLIVGDLERAGYAILRRKT